MTKQTRRTAQQQKRMTTLIVLGVPAIWVTSQSGATINYLSEYPDAVAKRDAGAFILDVRQPDWLFLCLGC